MSHEHTVSEIVTTFFLNTCRVRQPPLRPICAQQAACRCAKLMAERPPDDEEAELIPLTTGSVAEFYTEPMLPHVGDIDVMYHCSMQLAIPRGHPPPTQLPAEFHNYVKVCEIVDSHLPGYVYLELRYLLTECTDEGTYSYYEYDRGQCLVNVGRDARNALNIHGPAVLTDISQ